MAPALSRATTTPLVHEFQSFSPFSFTVSAKRYKKLDICVSAEICPVSLCLLAKLSPALFHAPAEQETAHRRENRDEIRHDTHGRAIHLKDHG